GGVGESSHMARDSPGAKHFRAGWAWRATTATRRSTDKGFGQPEPTRGSVSGKEPRGVGPRLALRLPPRRTRRSRRTLLPTLHSDLIKPGTQVRSNLR